MTAARPSARRPFLPTFALATCLGWGTAAPARAQEEVPFITTPDRVTLAMLQIARVGRQDRLIDLGSGDGRIVITAARRFGASGLGVEIVPDLVQRSRDAARQAGVADRAEFREQDLFKTDLSQATVITMYLLPEVNLQLRPALLALKPGTRVVSHDWDMGDWPPDRTLTLDVPEKAIGREKRSRVHLWWVPARVAGAWCGPGGRRLTLSQQYQLVQGRLDEAGGASQLVNGRVRGDTVVLQGTVGGLQLRWTATPSLGTESAWGPWRRWAGWRWQPVTGEVPCPG